MDTQTCGFPITINENFIVDVQFFYGQQGNLIRSLAHIQLRGTDSANGVSLPDTADFTHTFDFTTGINGDLGVTTHVIIPNGGTVLIDAGRVLSDEQGNLLFVAGNHQVPEDAPHPLPQPSHTLRPTTPRNGLSARSLR